MKTITLTIAAILTLQAGILFAGNETFSAPVTNERATTMLAPSVPLIATFEEVEVPAVDVTILAPAIPSEADFTDAMTEPAISMLHLAPLTPSEADFNDTAEVAFDIRALAPGTPAVADFE